ncbi:MAG: hypothetical protein QM776_03150 [Rhodocyclaceae bacterium]
MQFADVLDAQFAEAAFAHQLARGVDLHEAVVVSQPQVIASRHGVGAQRVPLVAAGKARQHCGGNAKDERQRGQQADSSSSTFHFFFLPGQTWRRSCHGAARNVMPGAARGCEGRTRGYWSVCRNDAR